jgi:hypothetical protein
VSGIGAVSVFCDKTMSKTATANTLNTTVSHKGGRRGVMLPITTGTSWSLMTCSPAQLARGFDARLQSQGQREF